MSDAGDVSANSETMGSEGKRTKPNLKGGRSRSKTCLREKRLINTKVCAFRQVWLGLVSGLHKSPDDCSLHWAFVVRRDGGVDTLVSVGRSHMPPGTGTARV